MCLLAELLSMEEISVAEQDSPESGIISPIFGRNISLSFSDTYLNLIQGGGPTSRPRANNG